MNYSVLDIRTDKNGYKIYVFFILKNFVRSSADDYARTLCRRTLYNSAGTAPADAPEELKDILEIIPGELLA